MKFTTISKIPNTSQMLNDSFSSNALQIEVKVFYAPGLIPTWMIADIFNNSNTIVICIALLNRNVVPLL